MLRNSSVSSGPTSTINNSELFTVAVVGDGGVGKSAITTRLVQGTFQPFYDPTIEDAYYVKKNIDNIPTQLEIIDTAGQEEYKALRSTYMRKSFGFVLVFDVTRMETLTNLKEFYEQIERVKLSESEEDDFSLDQFNNNSNLNYSLDYLFPFVFVANKIDMILENATQPTKNDKKVLKQLEKDIREQLDREIFSKSNHNTYNITNNNNSANNNNNNSNNSYNSSSNIMNIPLVFTSAKDNIGVKECFEDVVRSMRKFRRATNAFKEMNNNNTISNRSSKVRKSSKLSKLFGGTSSSSSSNSSGANILRGSGISSSSGGNHNNNNNSSDLATSVGNNSQYKQSNASDMSTNSSSGFQQHVLPYEEDGLYDNNNQNNQNNNNTARRWASVGNAKDINDIMYSRKESSSSTDSNTHMLSNSRSNSNGGQRKGSKQSKSRKNHDNVTEGNNGTASSYPPVQRRSSFLFSSRSCFGSDDNDLF
ncbi:hypothetical protein ABK040_007594 [Willaertia magna]